MRSRPPPCGDGRVETPAPPGAPPRRRDGAGRRAAYRRSEEPAVERRDAEIAGAAPGVRQTRHRAERVPEAGGSLRPLGDRAERLHAVPVAVDGVPERHQPAGLGEEQEQQAIDNRQRLLEGVIQPAAGVRAAARRADERAQISVDASRTPSRSDRQTPAAWRSERLTRPWSGVPPWPGANIAARATDQSAAHARGIVERQVQIELEEAPRVEASGIHDAPVGAVERDAPPRALTPRLGDGDAPEGIEPSAPRRHDQDDGAAADPERGAEGLASARDLMRGSKPSASASGAAASSKIARTLEAGPSRSRRSRHATSRARARRAASGPPSSAAMRDSRTHSDTRRPRSPGSMG